MDAKLSDKGVACRISYGGLQNPEFGSRILHEIDTLDSVYCCISTSFHQTLICRLKHCFFDTGIANDNELPHNQEGGNSRRFLAGGSRPYFHDIFYKISQDFPEREQVRDQR